MRVMIFTKKNATKKESALVTRPGAEFRSGVPVEAADVCPHHGDPIHVHVDDVGNGVLHVLPR